MTIWLSHPGKKPADAHHHWRDITASGHAQSRSHNDSCKGERTPNVDGAVVGRNGCGPLFWKQLWNQTEADGVLCGLSSCKADTRGKELPKIVYLKSFQDLDICPEGSQKMLQLHPALPTAEIYSCIAK